MEKVMGDSLIGETCTKKTDTDGKERKKQSQFEKSEKCSIKICHGQEKCSS